MSYRSIKRVLGETSLERKFYVLFGACLLVLISASFFWVSRQNKGVVNRQNRIMGRLLVQQCMCIVHWEELETDVGDLQLIEELKASLIEEDYRYGFIKQDLSGRVLFRPGHGGLPSGDPEIDDQSGEMGETEESDRELDATDQKMLKQFLNPDAQPEPVSDEPQHKGFFDPARSEYYYYQPIYANAEDCAMCHSARGNKSLSHVPSGAGELIGEPVCREGDLIAIAKISMSNRKTLEALGDNLAILLATAIVTVFLTMVASYVIVRYVIVKPLRHLRDVSDAISRGDISQRAEIHTGDEFESLAIAFNRMLRHLVTIQEQLRQVNASLDGKVDELAQVNMQLYEMNTVKSDFMATMSHELRTPLNSILGFSEVLGSIDSLDGKQQRYVQNIQNSGRMLLEMINDILDLAKMESGKMDTRLTDFRVEQIIHAQCDMARPLVEKKNIDLEIRLSAELPPIHQDQARVQQILNNLLSNAIKFTPEGGRIVVAAERDEANSLVMRVSDTGVGIAEEDQQTIFEKFRQGRTAMPSGDTMTREHSGSGLGLSIVKELCKLLGGEVSLESELGKGSSFTVRLPWQLAEQPRLDSAIAEDFDEFTRSRWEFSREHAAEVAEQPTQVQAAE